MGDVQLSPTEFTRAGTANPDAATLLPRHVERYLVRREPLDGRTDAVQVSGGHLPPGTVGYRPLNEDAASE